MSTRVIIAEDEAIIRLDLKETLQAEGYEVVGAYGRGDEALDAIRELKPDIAILDIQMPVKDGIEVATQITEESICAVLILTAFSQRALVEKARQAGAMAYLVKPYQAADLVPAIELALSRYSETKALQSEVGDLKDQKAKIEAQLEARRALERAKGYLMDNFKMGEAEAFRFIQTTAMNQRKTMKEISASIIEGLINPEK